MIEEERFTEGHEKKHQDELSQHFVLICLGNWGENYIHTRHNFGFMLAEHIVRARSGKFEDIGFGVYACLENFRRKLYVFKGKTFMNLSGVAAKRFLEFLSPYDPKVLIAHDDVDICFGRIKISIDGGAGRHRGIKSIIEQIGKDNIRIRMGIGRPKERQKSITDYVLEAFSEEEMEKVPKILENAHRAVEVILNETVEKAMSVFNSIVV